jgi:hypothetical protein
LENTTFRGLNYKIWLIFLTFFVISALAFIKPITGNPIVYNLCSKSISNGLGPKIISIPPIVFFQFYFNKTWTFSNEIK